MFNLGYKEVLLNSDEGVTLDGDVLKIKGYGAFDKTKAAPITDKPSQPPAKSQKEFDTGTIPGLASGDSLSVVLTYKSMRNISSQARNYIEDGKKIAFSTAPIVGTGASGEVTAADAATAIMTAYDAMFNRSGVEEQVIELYTTHPSPVYALKAMAVQTYAGFIEIDYMEVKVIQATKTRDVVPYRLTEGGVVKSASGHGQGKFLEESRRMGTFLNSAPYQAQIGGNSQGIDVRGTYRMVAFEIDLEDINGWESHEYVDHSYVNADTSSKSVRMVIYANENHANLMTILDSWIP